MNKLNTKNVQYRRAFEMDGSIRRPILATEPIYTSSIKQYNGVLFDLMALRHTERIVMDWVVDNMDKENMIRHDAIIRKKMHDDHQAAIMRVAKKEGWSAKEYKKIKPISGDSIIKAFSRLKSFGLLIGVSKGYYMVNPEYFFRGSEADRVKKVKVALEIKAGTYGIEVSVEAEQEQEDGN